MIAYYHHHRPLSLLFLGYYLVVVISASPSLPNSQGYFSPAEPNYPPINPFPKSIQLPASDKEVALLDAAYNQRDSTKVETMKAKLNMRSKQFKKMKPIESERTIVHMSSAMHPDNYMPQNKPIIPTIRIGPMSRDEFVINNEPNEMFVQPGGKRLVQDSESNVGFGPIINPSAYFLQGTRFDKISKPKCEMLQCEGPLPNDGTIRYALPRKPLQSCYQTFVPLNSCVADKGYPVGMMCTICCECSNSFINEMRKSRGFKIGFSGR